MSGRAKRERDFYSYNIGDREVRGEVTSQIVPIDRELADPYFSGIPPCEPLLRGREPLSPLSTLSNKNAPNAWIGEGALLFWII